MQRLYFLVCVLSPLWASGAENISALNEKFVDLSEDRKQTYETLARAYAPIFYADTGDAVDPHPELKGSVNPADFILSPFFDGDNDWSNNPINLFKVVRYIGGKINAKFPFKAKVPYSVAETATHYYISYVKYQALDYGPGRHGQDTEVVWTVVAKTDDPLGVLEFTATNAHGFANIYAPNQKLEKTLRRAYFNGLSYADRVTMQFGLPEFDYMSARHRDKGRPEFVSLNGRNMGLKVFVTRGSHALYKCRTDVWFETRANHRGYIYTPVDEGEEGLASYFPDSENPYLGYSLFSQDELIQKYFPLNQDVMPVSTLNVVYKERQKMFEGSQKDGKYYQGTHGRIRLRPDIPNYMVRGQGDKQPEANMAQDWQLKTPYKLAIPHLVHRYLYANKKNAQISGDYYFNPYIEYPPDTQLVNVSSPSNLRYLPNP